MISEIEATKVQNNKVSKAFTFFYATSTNGAPMLIASIITTYYTLFLTDELKIPTMTCSLIMLIATIWDAINDPIMGVIADRTNTRWGRYRPYFLVAPILLTIFTTLMWVKPNFSPTGLIIWVLITYIGYGMTVTLYTMPRMAILPAHINSTQERNKVIIFSTAVTAIAYSIGSTFKTQMVDFFSVTLKFENGYIPLMLTCGVIATICFWGLFATSKETYVVQSKKKPALREIVDVLKHFELYPLIMIWILASISYGMMFSTSVYYVIYFLARPDLVTLYMGIVSAGSLISMVFVMPIALKILKTGQRALVVTQIGSIVLYGILFIFGKDNLMLLYILTFLATSISAMQNGLVDVLVNDAIDYIQLKDGSSSNGVIASIKGFSQKCGVTVVKSGILAALGVSGYIANAVGSQPDSVMFTINFLRFGIPVIASIAMLAFLKFNPVEKYADEIEEMKQRQLDDMK